MTQPFVGKVEFQTAVDHKTRLTVDPDSPTSALLISNQDGSRVISIGDPNGNVALPNDLSATRIFVAGRPDLGGLIRVSDRNGREVISIDADARTIRISNPDNSRVIDLGGPNGNVALPNDLSATRIFAQDVILSNSDCAEDFDVADKVAAGAVVVIDEQGAVRECRKAYDKKVAGVISGAGAYKPAIVLDKQQAESNRAPVALVGKVYCQVDAQYSTIGVGDLLTTSATPGHAMKAIDPLKAFGAVLGKALRPLQSGQGLIPILVALQ